MTPQDFLAEYVTEDWENYVCLVDDPRNEYYRTYTVDCLQNVAGGPPVVYLNIPVAEMKAVTQRLLENGTPVWMGCDVGQQMDRERGLWDAKLYETQDLYGVQYEMDKAARLHHRQTMMTHAGLCRRAHACLGFAGVASSRWRRCCSALFDLCVLCARFALGFCREKTRVLQIRTRNAIDAER